MFKCYYLIPRFGWVYARGIQSLFICPFNFVDDHVIIDLFLSFYSQEQRVETSSEVLT